MAERLVHYGLHGQKKEVLDHVMRLAGGAELVGLPSTHAADEIAAGLHEDFPWMSAATTAAWRMLRTAAERREGVKIRPLLLNGPPGIGKSAWARRLAELVKVPILELDPTTASAGFAVVGTERGWGSASPGRPVETLIAHRIANPIVVVDEICKSKTVASTIGTVHSFADSLLSLLEPLSAARWQCPVYRLSFDLSHVGWVLTSNVLSQVTDTVRSRCQVVRLSPLTTADLTHFAMRLAGRMGLSDIGLEAVIRTIEIRTRAGEVISLRDVIRYAEIVHGNETRPVLH